MISPFMKEPRVLVADDDEDTLLTLTTLLRDEGYEARGVQCGADVLQAVFNFAPDVVLLDIGMPEVSGYDVARAIRREAWGRSMRLIALTGWGQAEHRRRSLEVGFDEHLVKPVELEVLEDVLQLGIVSPISGNG